MKFNCLHCNKEKEIKKTSRNDANKYCSNTCQKEFQFLTITVPRFLKGELHVRPTIKGVLVHLYGNKCVLCDNVGEYNGKPLILQLDHINGDAGNDMPDNVRLLCPNCHSQTDTFTAKNKGSGRGSRQINR